MSENSIFAGLKEHGTDFARTLGRKAIASAGNRVDALADRFDGAGDAQSEATKAGAQKIAEGESPAKAAVSAAGTGVKEKAAGLVGAGSDSDSDTSGGSSGGGAGSGDFKFTNIVEWTDVGLPLSVVYNAFTDFENWPTFMKKVEHVEWVDDVTLSIKGQVMWSHRTWQATISEQVADSHIVWDSTGEKGSISGSVTFHELAPRLTRMVVIGEYHPQGFVEKTANIWRAVGRRFRLELKFFVHHAMTEVIRDPSAVEGWRGEIHDGELVTSHEEALDHEEQDEETADGPVDEGQDDADAPAAEDDEAAEAPEADEPEDAPETDEPEDPAADEDQDEDPDEPAVEGDEPEDDQPADEDDEPVDEDDQPADEDDQPAEEDEDVEYEYVDVPADETDEDRDGRS
ncbi:SRPBCC family protein [Brachybacterium endophyticum]|nr:SRPBCC family protein [Brachybacterium endophyticum]